MEQQPNININTSGDKSKNILLLILAGVCVILAAFLFFGEDKSIKQQIKDLRADNERLMKEAHQHETAVDSLKDAFEILQDQDSVLAVKVKEKDTEIANLVAKANHSQQDLNKLLHELAVTRKKIEDLKKSPPNRTGDDLLNSLKIKTTK